MSTRKSTHRIHDSKVTVSVEQFSQLIQPGLVIQRLFTQITGGILPSILLDCVCELSETHHDMLIEDGWLAATDAELIRWTSMSPEELAEARMSLSKYKFWEHRKQGNHQLYRIDTAMLNEAIRMLHQQRPVNTRLH